MLFLGKGFSLLSSHFAYLMDFITKLGRPGYKLFRGPAESAACRPKYATVVLMSQSKGVCKTLRRVEYSRQDPQKLVTTTL